jgi:NADPH2:quinone reductase
MKALLVSAITPDLSGCSIAERDVPSRAPGQALVRVRAASLNFPDLLMTRGHYQLKPALPFVPGMDIAGEVVEADMDSGFAPGDAVAGTTRIGGLAEFAALDAAALRRKPERLDFSHAAAVGAAYVTAYVALVSCGALVPDQWVLVHGAAGGVGLAAVDLALTLGARVIAGSASADKLAVIESAYGPQSTLVTTSGFRDQVKSITGRGADLVFDPVGGDVFDESLSCVAFGGRLLVIGFASGRIPTVAANIPLIKGFSVVGVRAGEYCRRFPDRARDILNAVWSMVDAGRLHPRVHAEFPLSEWRAGFALMQNRTLVGKVVLRL